MTMKMLLKALEIIDTYHISLLPYLIQLSFEWLSNGT